MAMSLKHPFSTAFVAAPVVSGRVSSVRRSIIVIALGMIGTLVPGATTLGQDQISYRNTQSGRPVGTEDAYAVDRYSLDLHLAPVSVERSSGGEYRWAGNPEAIYGILPRTQIELGAPLVYRSNREPRLGVVGVNLGALYNLNAETRFWPALAVRAGVLLPAGGSGPSSAHPSVTMLGTRSHRGFRVHVNTRYTFRDEPAAITPADAATSATTQSDGITLPAAVGHVPGSGLSRWTTGLALDRSFPFASLLVAAETFAVRPFGVDQAVQWNAGLGARYQLTPSMTADAGIAKRLTGPDQAWSITLGFGRSIGVRSILPGFGRWGKR